VFTAYASVVRAAYLSAIVLGPAFMAENLVQIFRQRFITLPQLCWFLLFVALICLPSARAWNRISRGEDLIPTGRLRSEPVLAVLVACLCAMAVLAVVAYVYAKWIFEAPMPEGPEILPFMATILLYAFTLPVGELRLVGLRPPRPA